MSGNTIPVKVKAEDEDKLVVETRDGEEQTYCLNPSRTMYLHARRLQTSSEANLFRFDGDSLGLTPESPLFVRGMATLEDRSIAVIGDPDSAACTLAIGFHALDDELWLKHKELAQMLGKAPHYTHARVGLARDSGDIDDDWFVECQVPPATLRAMANAVSRGAMPAMRVGLALRGIYSSGARASQPVKTGWYLRPNRRDNSVDAPEMAYGDITLLSFEEAPAHSPPEAVPQPYAFDVTIPALRTV